MIRGGRATRVHLRRDGNEIEVWLDTDIASLDGLCIGLGATVPIALEDAKLELRVALRALEQAEYDGTLRECVDGDVVELQLR